MKLNTFLKIIYSQIRELNDSTAEFMRLRAEELILPGVLPARATAPDEEIAKTTCVVLSAIMYFDGVARLYTIGLRDKAELSEGERAIFNSPFLNELYKPDEETYGYYLGSGHDSPKRIGERLKWSIEKGIKVDAERNFGRNRFAGGGIDLAVIDQNGARFLLNDSKWTQSTIE
jgi:hypothetical protein